MAITDAVTREHVLSALADLDAGVEHSFSMPTKYEVLHGGNRYPLMAVIGLAVGNATGKTLSPDEFSGNDGPGQAHDALRGLGFNIVARHESRETVQGGETKELDPRIAKELMEWHQRLTASGELLTRSQLDTYYALFRERFGPDVLLGLDGEQLLDLMHNHSNRDSLVYWLEFKDDEEFPARFGSIAGGSALKFGIYRRKETGDWTTGSPQKQRAISVSEAIEIARRHREQLVHGVELLEQLPSGSTDAVYQRLQQDMNRVAPDVSNLAWGHKYFSLLFPDKLDDYHSPDWQRFHLMAVLQVPPEGDGRYMSAGRYAAIAQSLGIPLNHLTTILNKRTPRRSYWRVGTSDGTKARNQWGTMRDGNCVAIGWPKLGDLSNLTHDIASRNRIKDAIQQQYYKDPRVAGRAARQVLSFVTSMQDDDMVIACDGATVLGIGKIVGDYEFDESSDFPHRHPVEWFSLDEWKLPSPEGLQTSVHQLGRDPHNVVEIERRILGRTPICRSTQMTKTRKGGTTPRLSGLPGRIQSILDRKGQVILYGPPGTGKSYWAHRTACDLAALSMIGTEFASLDDAEKKRVLGDESGSQALVRVCCFHPAYGYEDFIEGYRPETVGDQMVFTLKDGVFKTLCEEASDHTDRRFYLIVDEINRGDIPRIFGELLHALEMDKRDTPLTLPISGEAIRVPRNVFVVGTMNTADRSIALLDTALRRRFGFIELMPDISTLADSVIEGIPLGQWLEALNRRICEHVGRDARNLQIGHAYLFDGGKPVTTFARFVRIIREELIPLLQEYCYEDYSALEQILGKGIVDAQRQEVRHQIFEEASHEDLVQALLAPCPDIATSLQATVAEVEPADDEDDEDEEV